MIQMNNDTTDTKQNWLTDTENKLMVGYQRVKEGEG